MLEFREIAYPNTVLRDAYERPTATNPEVMAQVYEPVWQAVEAAGLKRGDAFGAVIAQFEMGTDLFGDEARAAHVVEEYLDRHRLEKIADVAARITLHKRLAGGIQQVISLRQIQGEQ